MQESDYRNQQVGECIDLRKYFQMLLNCTTKAAYLSYCFGTVVVGTVLLINSAYAAQGGYTNYIPGAYGDFAVAVAPDPGFYWNNLFYYYTANTEKTVRGGKLIADLALDLGIYLPSALLVSDKKIFGGRYGFGAYIPIIYQKFSGSFSLGPLQKPFAENTTSFGDMGIIPISLWWTFDSFHIHAFEQITVPIGSYDKNSLVNAGLNYWSFDTNLAMTYLNQKIGTEISINFGHIYNTENNAAHYQTGQEFHADYMLNQFLSKTFAIGLHGFYYNQITGDSGSRALLGDFKGEVAGIGPALMWIPKTKNKNFIISVKWLHEYYAKHRMKGENILLNCTFKI